MTAMTQTIPQWKIYKAIRTCEHLSQNTTTIKGICFLTRKPCKHTRECGKCVVLRGIDGYT